MTAAHLIDQSVPRRLTLRLLGRLWFEPRVRAWWFGAICLAVVSAGFWLIGIRAHHHTMWLMEHGTPINAVVMLANDEWVKNRPQPPDSLVFLEFQWKGENYKARPRVLEGRKEFISTGSTLPIHVNPNNPEDWTWLNEPLPIATRLIGVMVSAPLAIICLLAALLRLWLAAQTIQHGLLIEALVVDTHFNAFAPLCPAVRTTPRDMGDNRVYTVYLPGDVGTVQQGEGLQVFRPTTFLSPVIALRWCAPSDF